MAQLRGATESGSGALPQLYLSGLHGWKTKAGRGGRFRDFIGLDRGLSGGGVVAYGVAVSAVREGVWAPPVDAALHQLRLEQG